MQTATWTKFLVASILFGAILALGRGCQPLLMFVSTETVEYRYNNGQLHERHRVNKRTLERQGEFTCFYDNGLKSAEGLWMSGQLDGILTVWTRQGELARRIELHDGATVSRVEIKPLARSTLKHIAANSRVFSETRAKESSPVGGSQGVITLGLDLQTLDTVDPRGTIATIKKILAARLTESGLKSFRVVLQTSDRLEIQYTQSGVESQRLGFLLETMGAFSAHLVADDASNVAGIDEETCVFRDSLSCVVPPEKISVDSPNGPLVVWNTRDKSVLGDRILKVESGSILWSSIGCLEFHELLAQGGRIAFVLDGTAIVVSHIQGKFRPTPILALGLFDQDPVRQRDLAIIMKHGCLPVPVRREK